MHPQQRAEGIAVGTLVGGQEKAVAGAQLGANKLQIRCGDVCDLGHLPSPSSSAGGSSSSNWEIRTPWAIVSS